MTAPRATATAAAPQSFAIGIGSATRSSQFMIMEAVHSLGSSELVGVRSTAR